MEKTILYGEPHKMDKEIIQLNGTHPTLDCQGCEREKISSEETMRLFLDTLPSTLGMHKIMQPFVLKYEWDGKSWDKGGISAFVMIAESHISIHTFPQDSLLTADVYSCKPFDTKKAIEQFKKAFSARTIKKNILKRDITLVRQRALARK